MKARKAFSVLPSYWKGIKEPLIETHKRRYKSLNDTMAVMGNRQDDLKRAIIENEIRDANLLSILVPAVVMMGFAFTKIITSISDNINQFMASLGGTLEEFFSASGDMMTIFTDGVENWVKTDAKQVAKNEKVQALKKDDVDKQSAVANQTTKATVKPTAYNKSGSKDDFPAPPKMPDPNLDKRTQKSSGGFSGFLSSLFGRSAPTPMPSATTPSSVVIKDPKGGLPSVDGTTLGSFTAHEESGGNASAISSGKGDRGGKSYGLFQITLRTMKEYLAFSSFKQHFAGLVPGSKAFDAKWKELGRDPRFAKDQEAYANKKFYEPAIRGLIRAGYDLSSRSLPVQEIIFGSAIQYGVSGSVKLISASLPSDWQRLSDTQLINTIYDYKIASVDRNFANSSEAVRKSIKERYERERVKFLDLSNTRVATNSKNPVIKVPTKNKSVTTADSSTATSSGSSGNRNSLTFWISENIFKVSDGGSS